MFDRAGSECATLMKSAKFGGHNMICDYIDTKAETELRKEYENVHNFTDAPMYKIQANPDYQILRQDYKFYCQHLVRGHNVIWFTVCNQSACKHCKTINQDSRGAKYLKKLGGHLFQPALSEQFELHYHLYMDANFINRSSYQVQVIDTEQHSRIEKDLGVCKNSGCRQFSFLSEADSKLHYRLAHGGKRGNDDSDTKVPRKFKYGKCNIS